jgi:hypothetical protein
MRALSVLSGGGTCQGSRSRAPGRIPGRGLVVLLVVSGVVGTFDSPLPTGGRRGVVPLPTGTASSPADLSAGLIGTLVSPTVASAAAGTVLWVSATDSSSPRAHPPTINMSSTSIARVIPPPKSGLSELPQRAARVTGRRPMSSRKPCTACSAMVYRPNAAVNPTYTTRPGAGS